MNTPSYEIFSSAKRHVVQLKSAVVSLTLLLVARSEASTLYWDPNTTTVGFSSAASTGIWNTNAYWTTDSTGTTGHGAYIADSDAVFTAGVLSVANTVSLTSSVSANSIGIQAGRWTFSGTGNPVITLGAGGLSLAAAGGGNLTGTVGGGTTFNNTVSFLLGASQTWTNNASNATNQIVVNGAVAGGATSGNTNMLMLAGNSNGSGFQLGGLVSDGAGGGRLAVTVNNATTGGTNVNNQLNNIANTFTGKVAVQSGGLAFNYLADAGVSSSLGAASGADSVIDLGAGTATGGLTLGGTSSGAITTSSSNRVINLAGTTGGGVIRNVAASSAVTLTLTGGVTNAGGGNKTLTLGGTNIGANVLSGVIADATVDASKTSVLKNEIGLWQLNGANTYTGGTTINAGTLAVGFAGTLGQNVSGNNITIAGGNLLLNSDSNVGANQSIIITSAGGGIGVSYTPTAFPTIIDNSGATGGVFGINYVGTGGIGSVSGINALFTSTSSWFLGSFIGGSGTYTGTSLTAGAGNNYRLGGGGGALTIQNNILTGANNLIVGSTGGGSVTLSNANTYSGTTTIQNGTLNVSSLNSVVGGSSSSSLGAPMSLANGTITIGSTTNVVGLNYIGTGETTDRVLRFNGTTGAVTLGNSGTGAINYSSAPVFSGNGAKTLFLGNANDSMGGSIGAITNSTGATAVTKQGLTNSRWILSGGAANTYTGNTIINGGVLETRSVADLATSFVSLSGVSGTQFGVWQTSGTISRTLSSTAGTSNLNWGPNSGFSARGGDLVLNFSEGATQSWGANGFLGSGTLPMVFGSSTADHQVELKNSFTLGDNVSSGFNRFIHVEKGVGGDSALLSGVISVGGGTSALNGITKVGAGTLILSGNNTYTGTTLLNAGKLLVNGDQTFAKGLTTVSSGATLGGAGIVGGAVTLNSGAFLTPGSTEDGIGLLTIEGSLTLNTGSAVVMQIAGAGIGARGINYDAIDVNGFTFSGAGSLVLNFGSLLSDGDQVKLFDGFALSTLSNAFTSVTLTGLYSGTLTFSGSGETGVFSNTINGQLISISNGSTIMTITGIAVPEPSTYAILGGMIVLGVTLIRRRRIAVGLSSEL